MQLDAPSVPAALAAGRGAAATVWRHVPAPVRDRWRLLDPANRLLVRLGAPAVAETTMGAGHRMRLDLRSGTEWFAFWTGRFDDGRVRAAAALLRPGTVAVDAGANIGLWAVPLAVAAGAAGARLLAFEPVPANARRLRENLALNDAAGEVLQVALSDRDGEVRMTLREDFAGGAATGNASVAVDDGTDARYATVTARSTTLDRILDTRARPPVSVLKADVEGHEDRLLAGARETFARDRPVAFLEWNAVYYARRDVDPTAAVAPLLGEWEYRVLRHAEGGWRVGSRFWSDRPLDDVVLVPAERVDEVLDLLP